MGRAFPRGGRRGFAGPFIEAALIAKPNGARRVRGGRGFAKATPHGRQIAAEVGVSAATVSRVLKRLGLNRLSALEPAEPIRRYERAAPGEIIHIDIKKLGSSVGSAIESPAIETAKATPAESAGNMSI
jgi:hypothetical protein